MIIECLTMREGITPVDIGKIRLNFMPRPRISKATGKVIPGPTTSFCDVTSEDHLKFLLDPRRQGRFRILESLGPLVVDDVPSPLAGYAVKPYGANTGNPGYVAFNVEKGEVAGPDGKWKKDGATLIPFRSEIDAYNWLKETLEAPG